MLKTRRTPGPPTRGQQQTSATVFAALQVYLTPIEHRVVCMRFGIAGYERVYDLVEIGDREGIPSFIAHRALLSGIRKLQGIPALRRLVGGKG
jgi:DNA-directed RNA polymerase sigma subunit (sigma70/sigma32)